MARPGRRSTGPRRSTPRNQRRVRDGDDVISVLARAVRSVEAAVQRRPATPSVRTEFQAVALLLREERARVRTDRTSTIITNATRTSSAIVLRRLAFAARCSGVTWLFASGFAFLMSSCILFCFLSSEMLLPAGEGLKVKHRGSLPGRGNSGGEPPVM